MPVRHGINEYPRMLFKGDESCVVVDAAEKARVLADGWEARALPGESDDELRAAAAPAEPEPERKKPGPKPKE